MLNFAICEDNLNILDKLHKMLEHIFIKNNLDASISISSNNPDEIMSSIKSGNVDVILLDINLNSNQSGLDLARSIREINKDIYFIFTTGHLEYAMIAYKFKTFDYLAKPITYERLEETISRLFEDVNGLPKRYIKIDNKNTLLNASEINYIKKDGMKLIFHTPNQDYATYNSFNKFQDNLPNTFQRCHKSYIANISKIKNIDPVSNTITFRDNSICTIGPKYKNNLMEVFNNYEFSK